VGWGWRSKARWTGEGERAAGFPPPLSIPWLASLAVFLPFSLFTDPVARFSKVPLTFRARNQIFKSKYKNKGAGPG